MRVKLIVQSLMPKSRFGDEVDEYLRLRDKSTRISYSSAFSLFLNFYQNKHGQEKGFGGYLDRIFEACMHDLQKKGK